MKFFKSAGKKRDTRIICTLGPATQDESMLIKMLERGMDVARINCSHGSNKQRQLMIDSVRKVNQKEEAQIDLLIDLAGYRIRIGHLKKRILLQQDQIVYMSRDTSSDDQIIPFDYEEDVKNITPNSQMFIDDGRLHLKVISNSGKKLKLKVIQGGILKERKGINIPTLKLQSNIMTAQDKEDLSFALKNKVEYIAQSFVRNKKDIQRVVDIVRPVHPDCKLVAKIESPEAVKNIDSILEYCDGVMVARGDLGVTTPLFKIPIMQKYIIRRATRKKKFTITATQMLDSMIDEGRPTRAEVSDVANAILDGTDYVMLSGETSVGKFPSRSVQTMRQIIEYTEKSQYMHL